MKITFFKHGKTKYNLEKRRQGRTDLDLSEEGLSEIKKLKSKLPNFNFDEIYSSPLKRAKETANLLFPQIEPIIEDLLIEYDFGHLEGVKFSTPIDELQDIEIEQYNNKKFAIPNNGETFNHILKRCQKFLNKVISNHKKDSHIGVFTHSTIIEIQYALLKGKDWHTYLANLTEFHGYKSITFNENLKF
jgi:broad specificity phosphatase PhoE